MPVIWYIPLNFVNSDLLNTRGRLNEQVAPCDEFLLRQIRAECTHHFNTSLCDGLEGLALRNLKFYWRPVG